MSVASTTSDDSLGDLSAVAGSMAAASAEARAGGGSGSTTATATTSVAAGASTSPESPGTGAGTGSVGYQAHTDGIQQAGAADQAIGVQLNDLSESIPMACQVQSNLGTPTTLRQIMPSWTQMIDMLGLNCQEEGAQLCAAGSGYENAEARLTESFGSITRSLPVTGR
jgi:hypothetical protein